jgi:hypothetical protein
MPGVELEAVYTIRNKLCCKFRESVKQMAITDCVLKARARGWVTDLF